MNVMKPPPPPPNVDLAPWANQQRIAGSLPALGPDYVLAEINQASKQLQKPTVLPDESPQEKESRLRQERFEKLGVTAAAGYMEEAQYDKTYRGRTWFANQHVMDQAEECLRICHCPACRIDNNPDIRATRLYVRIIDDPMQNFPSLAQLNCHNCGFEEFYPLRIDPRKAPFDFQTAAAQQLKNMEAEKQMGQLRQQHDQVIRTMVEDAARKLGIAEMMNKPLPPPVAVCLSSLPPDYSMRSIESLSAALKITMSDAEAILKSPDAELRRQAIARVLRKKGTL